MSSFPQHEKNIEIARSLGVDIDENDNYETWNYDELTEILSNTLSVTKALQQRNAELEAKIAELELCQNKRIGEIKALGIKEACQYFKENSWDFGNYTMSVRDLKDYAANLKAEEG